MSGSAGSRVASPRGTDRRVGALPLSPPPSAIVALVTLSLIAFSLVAFSLVTLSLVAAVVTAPAASAATTTTAPPPSNSTSASTSGPAAAGFHTPDQWVLGAIAAEEKIGSVRVDGKVSEGKSRILLDLLVNGDGEGGGVFVQQGDLVKVERVGTLLYLNAPKSFWATHATAAQTNAYGGKWLALNANDKRFASFDQFLDPTALVVAAFQGHTTPLTMGKPTRFAGHKVVVVTDTTTSNGKTTTETMYIGSAVPHYVYKIVDETPTEVGTIVFNHYGKAVPLTVPPEPLNLTNSP